MRVMNAGIGSLKRELDIAFLRYDRAAFETVGQKDRVPRFRLFCRHGTLQRVVGLEQSDHRMVDRYAAESPRPVRKNGRRIEGGPDVGGVETADGFTRPALACEGIGLDRPAIKMKLREGALHP